MEDGSQDSNLGFRTTGVFMDMSPGQMGDQLIQVQTALPGLRVVHSTNLHRAPATFFSSTDSGAILNRFSQDMTLIESQLPVGLLLTLSRM